MDDLHVAHVLRLDRELRRRALLELERLLGEEGAVKLELGGGALGALDGMRRRKEGVEGEVSTDHEAAEDVGLRARVGAVARTHADHVVARLLRNSCVGYKTG